MRGVRGTSYDGAARGADGPAPPVADPPAPPPRVAGRARGLPNSRAVVGGLLVAAAAVGTFAAWQAAGDGPSSRYAVAARDLAVGEVVGAEDIDLVAMDVAEPVAGAAFDADAASLLVGRVTVAPLAAGDLVQRSAVVVAGGAEPARQLSFAIDVSAALAGTLERGERVDVLATGGGSGSATAVVATDATVAQVVGDRRDGRIVVLLSVGQDTDLLALAGAARSGELTLVRTTPGGG